MLIVERLIWEDWNIAHIARHDVVPREVEEVCHDKPIEEKGYKGRVRFIGLTIEDRILAIILAPQSKAGVYYPVTARPASKKERLSYQQGQGGEKVA